MNWFKKLHPFASDEQKRLYNYIKSQPLLLDMYHGTSEVAWQGIQSKGFFYSGSVSPVANNFLPSGNDRIFFTPNYTYASTYAKTSAVNQKSKAVVISIKIPLYLIKEIKMAILGNNDYQSAYSSEDKIHEIINAPVQDMDKVQNLIRFIKQSQGQFSEFSTDSALSIKYVSKVDVISDVMLEKNDAVWLDPQKQQYVDKNKEQVKNKRINDLNMKRDEYELV